MTFLRLNLDRVAPSARRSYVRCVVAIDEQEPVCSNRLVIHPRAGRRHHRLPLLLSDLAVAVVNGGPMCSVCPPPIRAVPRVAGSAWLRTWCVPPRAETIQRLAHFRGAPQADHSVCAVSPVPSFSGGA